MYIWLQEAAALARGGFRQLMTFEYKWQVWNTRSISRALLTSQPRRQNVQYTQLSYQAVVIACAVGCSDITGATCVSLYLITPSSNNRTPLRQCPAVLIANWLRAQLVEDAQLSPRQQEAVKAVRRRYLGNVARL